MRRTHINFFEAKKRGTILRLRRDLNRVSKRCCWLRLQEPTPKLQMVIDRYEQIELELGERLSMLGDL